MDKEKKNKSLGQEGQGMVEYALILAFIVVVATISLNSRSELGKAVTNIFSNAANLF